MLALLRQRNFALLWWGGLISLTGNRVLSVALPFYVYQQTGSTGATATMVMATIIPSMLFGTAAGVLVDRWHRKQVMVVANFILTIVLLPLLIVPKTDWIWLIYVVAFSETVVAIFFRLAENALLPQLVAPDQLLTANALNSLNDTLARLIGPALGGLLLGIWGLESVIISDSLSYLLAGLLIFLVKISTEKRTTPLADKGVSSPWWRNFRDEWRQSLVIVRQEQMLLVLFVVVGLTTFGGTMMDPLYAPFIHDIVQGGPTIFGWLLTIQGIGGILGGLSIGLWGRRVKPAPLFGVSAITVGVILFFLFQSTTLPIVFLLAFLAGFPSVGARVGLQTLLQESVTDAYRGRIGGMLTTTGSMLELGSVGFVGMMGDRVGIVPMLSGAAGLTSLAGVVGLWLLPRATPASNAKEVNAPVLRLPPESGRTDLL